MLVFFVLGNAKVLSFALGDAKVPNANGFASQWNIVLTVGEHMVPNAGYKVPKARPKVPNARPSANVEI